MKGSIVPTVLIPRFTTYIGADTYESVPIDVSAFAGGVIWMWAGPKLGTSPVITAYLEESQDTVSWTTLATVTPTSPAASSSISFSRRWLRVRVETSGTDVAVSCWASGDLELRVRPVEASGRMAPRTTAARGYGA